MTKDSRRSSINLPLRVVILLVTLVVLSSLAIGIPAIWLVRDRLSRHAWDLAVQGSQTGQALLAARQSELENLATLTAQRPTLARLIELSDQEELAIYLETFREGAGLDLVMLCDREGKLSVQVGKPISEQTCQTSLANQIYPSQPGSNPPGWMLFNQEISLSGSSAGRVFVGQAIDADFLNQLKQKTGMEHLFLYDGKYLFGSIPNAGITWQTPDTREAAQANSSRLSQGNQSFVFNNMLYYAIRAPFGETPLETIVALSVSDILEAQRRLTMWMVGGLLLGSVIFSVLGIILVRRLNAPLENLRDSAIALRKGDLNTPVIAETNIPEIAQVAYALEDARIALRHTLIELSQQKAWVDHLLESVVEGIVTLDRHGLITFFSRGAEQITGLNQEEVIGKSIDNLFGTDDRQYRFSQKISTSDRMQNIVSVLVGDKPITLAITRAKLAPPEAQGAYLALVLRDVTNENAIHRLLGDFLANITHEFRTPLTAQAVSIELLLDQLDELNPNELRELLGAHYLGVLNLQTLIDNLLEGASIEAGRFHMNIQPTDLEEVITEVVQSIQPLMEKYNLSLLMELPENLPVVSADPRRTNQVLVNLLSNAIKWGKKGTEILLKTTVCNDEVKIEVADRGPGIPVQQKQELFKRFSDLQTSNSRAEYGAGLGLFVVKTIVESQGGQVGVEDQPGGGTIFWFTIPINGSQAIIANDC